MFKKLSAAELKLSNKLLKNNEFPTAYFKDNSTILCTAHSLKLSSIKEEMFVLRTGMVKHIVKVVV